MSHGPVLIFDKSTLEALSLDESVLLHHFYRANIPPIFFVECLADLEFEIKRRKRMTGTPEQPVASLAERTPDSESSVNMYHMSVLQEELAGRFDRQLPAAAAHFPRRTRPPGRLQGDDRPPKPRRTSVPALVSA